MRPGIPMHALTLLPSSPHSSLPFSPRLRSEPPSSWLTRRTMSGESAGTPGSGTGGSGDAGLGFTPAAEQMDVRASLDLSALAATMPSVTGVDGPTQGSDQTAETACATVQVSNTGVGDQSPTPAGGTASSVPSQDFAVNKVFLFKDLDTGQEYLMDQAAADSMMNISGAADQAGGSNAKVRHLQSGREITVKEFEDSLGLSPLMREVTRRERSVEASREGEPQELIEGAGVGVSVAKAVADAVSKTQARKTSVTAEEKKAKKPFGRNPGRWFTKRLGEAAAYLGGGEGSEESPVKADGPGFTAVQDDPALRAVAAAATASGQLPPSKPPVTPPGTTDRPDRSDEPGEGPSPRPLGREGVGSTVKVHVNRKVYKEYTDMRLIQVLHAHEDAVWTMKFSHHGEYLATAGQDRVVRVWALDREDGVVNGGSGGRGEGEGIARKIGSLRLRGELLFREKPHREYAGHRGDILDLCWSHSDFLLSSSMDKTVRLWYMTMNECLRIFSHQDFVTAIDFNPVNDKYFLSGSLDGKLRFWNIPDHRVADWVDIGEMVTAACFTSDGTCAVAGSYKGKCHFYSMDGVRFEYLTQLEVRNSRSKKTSGKKITGLAFMPGDDRKLLVTSNDSRIRVYDGYTLACKYKGHKNNNSQIRASFSPGAEFIVCGSEDEHVYVWSTINSFVPSINPIYTGYRRDKHSSYEQFAAQHDIATVALFAPEAVRNARTGEAAAAVAAARATATAELQPTRAAAALFKGGNKSPGGSLTPRLSGHHHSRSNSHASTTLEGKEAVTAAAVSPGRESSAAGSAEGVKKTENGGGAASVAEGTSASDVGTEAEVDPRAEARAEGERAFAAGMAIGQIIVTAGYSGEIRIFENVGSPCWL